MSTLKERIEEIQEKMGWDNQAMGNVAGVSRSAVAQWRGQGSKIIHSIGNMQAAENLERETGYAALWIAKGEGPKLISQAKQSALPWPFTEIDENKVRSLGKSDLTKLEGAFLAAAGHVGLDIKKP